MSKKSVKLVMYSGGQERTNHEIHDALIELTGRPRRISMTYIPFCLDGAKPYFNRFIQRYRRFGGTDFHCLPVDSKFAADDLKKALESDIIYLAGGNTFYFLYHLRKSRVFNRLKNYALNGGVLAGLSAGAIMMTPNIELAGFPPYDPDENDVGIKNLNAMNLVDFEFFPHFINSKRNNEAMMMYSLVSANPIFACRDGDGIIVNGREKTFLGEVNLFLHGKKIKI